MNEMLRNTEEAQRLLGGIGRTSLFALIRSGELGTVKVGRRRMVPQSQIDAYVNRHLDASHRPEQKPA